MRRLVGQPILSLIIVTLALQAFLDGVVTLFWGDYNYLVYPKFLPPNPVEFLNIILSLQHIIIFFITMFVIGLFIIFFKYSKWGLDMRAVAEDHQAGMCMGISTKMVFILAWVIATLLAYIGGVLLGSINGVSTTLHHIAANCFPVVLLGGLESIPGVLIAGLIVGVLEYISGLYLDPIVGASTREIVPYIILVLVLIIKPYGLFGLVRIRDGYRGIQMLRLNNVEVMFNKVILVLRGVSLHVPPQFHRCPSRCQWGRQDHHAEFHHRLDQDRIGGGDRRHH